MNKQENIIPGKIFTAFPSIGDIFYKSIVFYTLNNGLYIPLLIYLVNLHNYCSDDMDINMKWYIVYIVYSTHL